MYDCTGLQFKNINGRWRFLPDNAIACEHINDALLEGQVGREYLYPFSVSQTLEINVFLDKILALTDTYLSKREELAESI